MNILVVNRCIYRVTTYAVTSDLIPEVIHHRECHINIGRSSSRVLPLLLPEWRKSRASGQALP